MCVNDSKMILYGMYAFESLMISSLARGRQRGLGRMSLSLLVILSWRVIRIVGVRGQRCAVGASRSVGRRGSAARHGHQLG